MIDNEHVRKDFQATLDHQSEVGAVKIISKWFFQPHDIFDAQPRQRMKSGVVLCLTYLTLIVAVCAAFNSR